MKFIKDSKQNKFVVDGNNKYLIPDIITQNALGYKDSIFVLKTKKQIEALHSSPNIEKIDKVKLIWEQNNQIHVFALFQYPSLIKRHVPNPLTLFAIGQDFSNIVSFSKEKFNQIPTGEPLETYDNWDTIAKKLANKNIPNSKNIQIRINVFGPIIHAKNIPKYLNYHAKDSHEIHNQIDVQAHLLGVFFNRPPTSLSDKILYRYLETTNSNLYMGIVPHTDTIADRLIDPLTCAKREYCLGEYISTIALCGIVGEMIALMIWKMNDVKLNTKQIDDKSEINIFGKSFEELDQYRRINILFEFKFITEKQRKLLDELRIIRTPHLHRWKKGEIDLKANALKAYSISFSLFKEIANISYTADKVTMNPLLLNFINNEKNS